MSAGVEDGPLAAVGWLSLPELAERLDVEVRRVRQLLRERKLIAVRPQGGGALAVPADFVVAGGLLKGLAGTLTLLWDAGYHPEEALRWLYTEDDSLPGTPVRALAENRGTEVKRRAQALGY